MPLNGLTAKQGPAGRLGCDPPPSAYPDKFAAATPLIQTIEESHPGPLIDLAACQVFDSSSRYSVRMQAGVGHTYRT